ncbi:hypothetical protein OG921_01735 [Aldersonia sp. NBC_00410]|uniref:hypothetical protein n=1 Tax=Aldersonia sp. NBC_00410 TaxID=2975954 RepID=UPI002255589B|nr:hypothetical protein [Aldersonia sp. NBC_00410]MCX5041914.1 hypothetical protein [Aldersonia sp. NBC_00410]
MATPTNVPTGSKTNGGGSGVAQSVQRQPHPALSKLRNATPKRLHVTNSRDQCIVFAPLETRALDEFVQDWPWDELLRRGLVTRNTTEGHPTAGQARRRPRKREQAKANSERSSKRLWRRIWAWVRRDKSSPETVGDGRANQAEQAPQDTAGRTDKDAVDRSSGEKQRSRRGVHLAALWSILLISVGAPIIAYFAHLMPSRSPGVAISFVAIATMLPGLLFFLFDRQRLSTLRDRFERQIFRLDPNVETLADVEARYGSQMDEVFFPRNAMTTTVNAAQRLWPIVIATEVIALGWIMSIHPSTEQLQAKAPEGGATPYLYAYLDNPLSFAFLGSYFFSLNMCLRRYARNDLRPKAYSAITVRVITVVVLAYLLQAIVGEQESGLYKGIVLPLAFVVGVLPETAMVLLRDRVQGFGQFAVATNQLEEQLPLTELEGIDLYDRARLIDEGVSNIEGLAHHDFVDLLLETRIPAGRLVDWVDQAILDLHLRKGPIRGATPSGTDTKDRKAAKADAAKAKASEAAEAAEFLVVRNRLRALGVRTATDLIASARTRKHRRLLGRAFARSFESDETGMDRLNIFLATICDDEWMSYVQSWRSSVVRDLHITLDDNGFVTECEHDGRDDSMSNGQAGRRSVAGGAGHRFDSPAPRCAEFARRSAERRPPQGQESFGPGPQVGAQVRHKSMPSER